MIENEEKVVYYLEELDNNFSKINRTLKEIESKIEMIYKTNKKVISDYKPFMNMFSNNTQAFDFPIDETLCDSSLVMKSSSPQNPFTENITSSEITNNQILNKFQEDKASPSTTMEDIKIYSELYVEDSSSSEISEFDINMLPEIFKSEEDLFKIYEFINKEQIVKFEALISEFKNIEYEKLIIYLDLLKNKKFIKKKGLEFYIPK